MSRIIYIIDVTNKEFNMAQFATMAMIEASIKKATNGRLPVKMIVHKKSGRVCGHIYDDGSVKYNGVMRAPSDNTINLIHHIETGKTEYQII